MNNIVNIILSSEMVADHFVERNFSLPKNFFGSEKVLVPIDYNFFLLKEGVYPKKIKSYLNKKNFTPSHAKSICFDTSTNKEGIKASMYMYSGTNAVHVLFFIKKENQFEELRSEAMITIHEKGFLKGKVLKPIHDVDFSHPSNLGI